MDALRGRSTPVDSGQSPIRSLTVALRAGTYGPLGAACDPFRLEFDPAATTEELPAQAATPSLPAPETAPSEEPAPAGEKIVSLDAFRKKP